MKVCVCTATSCGPNVKGGWSASYISAFWIRNGSQRIKLSNKSVSVITHDCDFEKLFPDNSLNEDKYNPGHNILEFF